MALGVLTQEWGGKRQPVAYLSRVLDPVSKGWPECVQAVAATALLVEEARKLTFGGALVLSTPYQVRTILTQRAGRWLTDSRILKYEAILLEKDDLVLTTDSCVNPAIFLWKGKEEGQNLEHQCLDIIEYQTKVRADLREKPLPSGQRLFIDGSSRVIEGKRRNGYAISYWWSGENLTQPNNPFENIAQLKGLRKEVGNVSLDWKAPDGLYWICGKFAYTQLPKRWTGACVLGTVRPSFFLLPIQQGECLGIPVYDEMGIQDLRNWKDNEWPPERIIQYYGTATWAEDGSWGYRTPIYMLNCIIRLQAVLEIITNETAVALNLLAKQNTQLRMAVYQNRLALDYLLAKEGEVCGKFNLTNCCLQIDDQGKAIEEITARMRKIAHVPVQTWNGVIGTSW
ncbi:Endogenous retrovirus group 3 member 1 Env polyprotein [Varanus komodoensis]|nr:Endogenous retrovirus group 3 member 1 Env polyprotein [Varanus komodoensis]